MIAGYVLTALVALIVGFLGARATERDKRVQDRLEALTQCADDVLDTIARMHETGRMTKVLVEETTTQLSAMRRTASRYIDGRDVSSTSIRDAARAALTLRDAAVGRRLKHNRGTKDGGTSTYLFSHGRLPNRRLADYAGAGGSQW